MSSAKRVLLIIFSIAVALIVMILYSTKNVYYGAQQVYRVYLKGKSIALIDSKENLEKYIDEQQEKVKKQYNVNKVYIPTGLEIKEETTYNKQITSVAEAYQKIKETESFSIEGYVVTIEKNNIKEEDEQEETTEVIKTKINVLSKKIFTDAINELVLSFVDEKDYENYLNESQQEIKDEGNIIENIYIKETIKIKKDYVSTNENIFTDSKDLAEYLLYGSLNAKKTYTVKDGDTIASISEKNEISNNIFLILNKDINSENALLYAGQQVIVTQISPLLTIVEEIHSIAIEDVKYQTVTKEDSSYMTGFSKVIQEGQNGQSIITRKIQKENGQTTNALIIESNVIKEPVNKIVKVGARTQYLIANTKYWAWPTITSYITDYFEMRYHPIYHVWRMHTGIDIAGKCGQPVYAANDGTVTTATYHRSYGNYIDVNHNNGYITRYAHLSKIMVEVGQAVYMGEQIGKLGTTGDSTGCHLHYETKKNDVYINPFLLYQ